MPDRLPLLIDCDPGHDDAVAILVGHRHFALQAITTVHGNAPLAHTSRNALKVLELAGIDGIPVAVGAERPLVSAPAHAGHVHGKSGLDGHDLPEPRLQPVPEHAVELIVETARAHQGELILAAIGPQTNIALALRQEPRLAGWVREFTFMGGSAGTGGMTPAAEFNAYADPEAVAITLAAGWPIRMVGYELTRTVGIDPARIAELRASGKRTAGAIADLVDFYRARQVARYNLNLAPMHDACALIPYLDPLCIQYLETRVEMELAGTHTRGATVCDIRGGTVENPNVRLAHSPDRERLLACMMETVLSYP